jgi:FolB domain-containing protein
MDNGHRQAGARARPWESEPSAALRSDDWIELTGMSFAGVIGLESAERARAQPLWIDVALRLDLDGASAGDLARSFDYGTLVSEIELIAVETRFRLLESLAAAVACHLLAPSLPAEPRAAVDEVRVKIAKPEIFAGGAVPSVEISRRAAWLRARACSPEPEPEVEPEAERRDASLGTGWSPVARAPLSPVRVECLQRAGERGAHHVTLAAGALWTLPADAGAQVLAGAVEAQPGRLTRGARPVPGTTVRADGVHGARLLLVGASSLA